MHESLPFGPYVHYPSTQPTNQPSNRPTTHPHQALQQREKHIPYRNSKLTRLLEDSLGSNRWGMPARLGGIMVWRDQGVDLLGGSNMWGMHAGKACRDHEPLAPLYTLHDLTLIGVEGSQAPAHHKPQDTLHD